LTMITVRREATRPRRTQKMGLAIWMSAKGKERETQKNQTLWPKLAGGLGKKTYWTAGNQEWKIPARKNKSENHLNPPKSR